MAFSLINTIDLAWTTQHNTGNVLCSHFKMAHSLFFSSKAWIILQWKPSQNHRRVLLSLWNAFTSVFDCAGLQKLLQLSIEPFLNNILVFFHPLNISLCPFNDLLQSSSCDPLVILILLPLKLLQLCRDNLTIFET